MTFGHPVRHLRSCPSTNTVARELAERGAVHGTVVTTGMQTEGRGRQGRSWFSAPADSTLAYSAIVRAGVRAADAESEPDGAAVGGAPEGDGAGPSPLLPLVAAVAACEAIEKLAPVETAVKWPNDIWIEGRKCAGILIEGRPQKGWAVIGIGINLTVDPEQFPADLRETATSVGHGVELADARTALSENLGVWLAEEDDAVLCAFARRDALRGRTVEWDGRSGTAGGVDRSGSLIVRLPDGSMAALTAGEVHLAPVGP